jgi:hypothetical protein|tara:strand:+ start:531 stop:674 length:144 start_codon:yes stop_codon:yes gene_type:complete
MNNEYEPDELSEKLNEIKSICQECDSTNKIGVDLDLMSIIDICNEIK